MKRAKESMAFTKEGLTKAQALSKNVSMTSFQKNGVQEFRLLKKSKFDEIVAERKAKLALN